MAEESENAIKIAVIESQLSGLREQHRAHSEQTRKGIEGLSGDVRNLVAVMNKGKGAFGFAMVLAGGLGAGAAAIMNLFMGVHK